MTESYYKLCLKELSTIKERKKLLLHSCCAPCSSSVITFLTKYFDITIQCFERMNPFIEPIKNEKG